MTSSWRRFHWRLPARHFRINRALMALLLIASPIALAACTAPAVTPRIHATATLGASDFITRNHYDEYHYDGDLGYCQFPPYPSLIVPSESVLVGSDNYFRDNTFCIEKYDWAYRAGVRFDLSELRSYAGIIIEKATLSWKIDYAKVEDSNGGYTGVRSGSDVTNCVGALMESKQNLFRKGSFLPGIPYRKGQGDVTSLVQSWVMNGDPNLGFVLVGLNESYSRNNAACVNVISHLTLTINYSRL